jgi:hypothetical protein
MYLLEELGRGLCVGRCHCIHDSRNEMLGSRRFRRMG